MIFYASIHWINHPVYGSMWTWFEGNPIEAENITHAMRRLTTMIEEEGMTTEIDCVGLHLWRLDEPFRQPPSFNTEVRYHCADCGSEEIRHEVITTTTGMSCEKCESMNIIQEVLDRDATGQGGEE